MEKMDIPHYQPLVTPSASGKEPDLEDTITDLEQLTIADAPSPQAGPPPQLFPNWLPKHFLANTKQREPVLVKTDVGPIKLTNSWTRVWKLDALLIAATPTDVYALPCFKKPGIPPRYVVESRGLEDRVWRFDGSVPIGAGSYSEVYLGMLMSSAKTHAAARVFKLARPCNRILKRASSSTECWSEALDTIAREAHILKGLHSGTRIPGIISAPEAVIASEFYGGSILKYYHGTLDELPSSIPPDQLVTAFHVGVKAMALIHQIGLIHGDIKTSNMLFKLRDPDHPKGQLRVDISDWGDARTIDEMHQQPRLTAYLPLGVHTRGNVLKSDLEEIDELAWELEEYLTIETPKRYTVLEQIATRLKAADVYAFAAAYFEVFTGQKPHDVGTDKYAVADTANSVRLLQIRRTFELVRKAVPYATATIISRMLATQPIGADRESRRLTFAEAAEGL